MVEQILLVAEELPPVGARGGLEVGLELEDRLIVAAYGQLGRADQAQPTVKISSAPQ